MPTVKISDLTELTATPASDDLVVVVDSSTNETKKITYGNLLENVSSDTLTVATSATFTSLTASDDVNFDSNTLFVDASENKVGIGTSSPSAKLTIIDNPATTGAPQLSILPNQADVDGVLAFPLAGNSKGSIIANKPLTFHTNTTTNTANERMRIDVSGNVGIGTDSPAAKLQVQGETRIYPASGTAVLRFGSGGVEKGKVSADTSSNLIFEAGGTERVRITSSGSVGIGTSSPSNDLHISSSSSTKALFERTGSTGSYIGLKDSSGSLAYLGVNNGAFELQTAGSSYATKLAITSAGTALFKATSTPGVGVSGVSIDGAASVGNIISNMALPGGIGFFFKFFTSTQEVGSISVVGSTTTYATSSDYRLKENLSEMTGSVDRVKSMNPVNFNFIGEDRTVDGFLAHEIQAIVPEAVVGEKDAVDDDGNPIYQGIDQSKLVPVLVAAIKELTARIEALEAGA